MAVVTHTCLAIEVQSVIRFLHLKKIYPAEIHRQLVEVYGDNVMSRKKVWFLCKECKLGRTNVRDEQMGRAIKPVHYSSDRAPSDFYLCGPLKKRMESRHFRTDAEVQEVIVKWLRIRTLICFSKFL
ncbi:hypothetical protein AVEN_50454-1 [Araneus ventricosus]|uniref:Mos1 transposase HTH domain-containing protein n=1 Tax=Araneus ventricosus TaxID=182803 RepID=A0A4Y2H3X9_ARAVE|nr:hypothetical protein AVEN_50454-1 [Araneus ventricosus]